MEAQRLEVLERKLKRMERLIRGVVAGWILSILGVLVFGLITRPVFTDPAPPRMLTVHGISVVDEQGREHASIDTTPDGHPIMIIQMTTAETRHAVFSVQTSTFGASLSLGRGYPADYVQLTETGIEVARGGRIVWHVP